MKKMDGNEDHLEWKNVAGELKVCQNPYYTYNIAGNTFYKDTVKE